MTNKIISGREIANAMIDELKERRKHIDKEITLSIIHFEGDKQGSSYIKSISKLAEKLDINIQVIEAPIGTTSADVVSAFMSINRNININAIMVQLPLPSDISPNVIEHISPDKDVDGLTSINIGKLWQNKEHYFVPSVAQSVIEILERSNIEISGKNVTIINRSNIIGKPLSALLLQKDATVTIAHSKTSNIDEVARNADILISAVGVPNFINDDMIKNGAIVIDVSTNFVDGKLVGDVEVSEEFKNKCGAYTPVPGGVGPVASATLLKQIIESAERQNG